MSDIGTTNLRQQFGQIINNMTGPQLERTITEMLIQAAQYSDELTPIATGNLINSRYRNVRPIGDQMVGEAGYTANYAAYVHEAQGKLKGLGVYRSPRRLGFVWGPDGEPKFLEKGRGKMLREDAENIINRNMEPRL